MFWKLANYKGWPKESMGKGKIAFSKRGGNKFVFII